MSTLATPLKYRDTDGNIGGDFNISEVCRVVARDGGVRCRTSFVDDVWKNPWLELPLLHTPRRTSSARSRYEICTTSRNFCARRGSWTRRLARRRTRKSWSRPRRPNARRSVYPPARPPADWEELVQATAAECAEMKGRGGHYDKLDEATVAEAVATSKQPPAEEATDHAANGVHVYPKAQLVLLACDCKIFLMSLVPAACVRLQDFFDVPCASRRRRRF